jgi:hypothetical protein
MRPYLEKAFHNKRASGVAQGIDPELKPEYWKKKKKHKYPVFSLICGI